MIETVRQVFNPPQPRRFLYSGAIVRLSATSALTMTSLLLSGCTGREGTPSAASNDAIQSIHTELKTESCTKEPDKTDPNETPYLVCPGVAGYKLIVRRVDAGRKSIDVVDAGQRVFPLNYQEVVTRHMFTLGDEAEWRVTTRDGRQVPIALAVRVRAREDNDHPEKVTRTYLAVAKITPSETCVTDSIPEGTKPDDELRRAVDGAQGRRCAPPQPPMTSGGTVIR
jgi:hypothetical protein